MKNSWKCDLSEIAQNVCELMRFVARSRGLVLDNQVEPITMDTYDPRISQVILHLTCDAVRNARRDSVVSIKAFVREEHVEVSIAYQTDDVSRSALGPLFRRHSAGTCSQSRLGLDYCMKIVCAYGGSGGVTEVPGIGSTLWFSVPRRYDALPTLRPKELTA